MIIIDYYSKGESHSDGNAAMVAASAFSTDETIYLFCERKHYECILRNIDKFNFSNIEYIEIQVKPNQREYSRFILDYSYVKQIFDFAKKHNETKILSLYTTTLFLYYFKLFLFLNKKIEGISVAHSELERLYKFKYVSGFSDNKLGVFLYILFFGLCLPLSINLRNYKVLVYGESIKQNLLKRLPLINKKNVIAINHPYIIGNKDVVEPFANNNINFGVIGLIDVKKNGKNLKYLFDDLKSIDKNNFKLSMIGHFRTEETLNMFKPYFEENFIEYTSKDNAFIPKELRDEKEALVDYNVFTYNTDGYKLTASGAFIDAVCFEKPIIAIKNDYFEYYFNKYGNIGYLCETYEEMRDKIVSIINEIPREEYLLQKQNIKLLKQELDVRYLVQQGGKFFE